MHAYLRFMQFLQHSYSTLFLRDFLISVSFRWWPAKGRMNISERKVAPGQKYVLPSYMSKSRSPVIAIQYRRLDA